MPWLTDSRLPWSATLTGLSHLAAPTFPRFALWRSLLSEWSKFSRLPRARRIAETFGEDFESVLLEEPARVAKAAGVPAETALHLRTEWLRRRDFRKKIAGPEIALDLGEEAETIETLIEAEASPDKGGQTIK